MSKRGKKTDFLIHCIIVPMKELTKRVRYKTANKNGKLNFYFKIENKNVYEIRERKNQRKKYPKAFDYSSFLNRWDLITEKYAVGSRK